MQPSSIFFLTFLRQSHARGDPAFWRNRCAGPGSGAPILTLGTLLSSSALSHQRASLVGGEGLGTERLRIVAAVHDLVAIKYCQSTPSALRRLPCTGANEYCPEPPTSRLLRSLDGGTDVDMHASLCLGRQLLDQTGLKPGGSAILQSLHFAVSCCSRFACRGKSTGCDFPALAFLARPHSLMSPSTIGKQDCTLSGSS